MDQASPFHATYKTEAQAGLRDIAPAAIAAVPIGLLFGAVAAAKGLSAAEVALMSTLVFAGGAQFAAVEAWTYPVPVAALAFATLLINARHVLMGASLSSKFQATRRQKLVEGGEFGSFEAASPSVKLQIEKPGPPTP
jgi:predicted branched-subunit amino acid permease